MAKKYLPVVEGEIGGKESYNHLKVEVGYDLGGFSCLNGSRRPRGMKLYFQPVNISNTGTGFQSESFVMFDDTAYQVHLLDMARDNKKTVEKFASKLNELGKDELMDLYRSRNIDKILNTFGVR